MAKLLDENSLTAVKTYVDGTQTFTGIKTHEADIKMAKVSGSGNTKILFDITATSVADYSAWIGVESFVLTINAPGGLKVHDTILPEKPSGSTAPINLGGTNSKWDNLYLSGSIIDDNGNSKTLAQLIAGSTVANPSVTVGTNANLTSIKINTTDYNIIQWDSAPTSGHGAGYGVTSEGIATAISNAISSVYRYKGSVASYANLPSTGLTIGDVYNVQDTGANYAWTGTAWDELGGDVSTYALKSGGSSANHQVFTGFNDFSQIVTFSGGVATDTIEATRSLSASGDVSFDSTVRLAAFKPANDNDYSLGTSSLRWKNVYVSGNISDGTNSVTISQLLPLNQGILSYNEALAILQGSNS